MQVFARVRLHEEGKTYEVGSPLEVTEERGADLIRQGVAVDDLDKLEGDAESPGETDGEQKSPKKKGSRK